MLTYLLWFATVSLTLCVVGLTSYLLFLAAVYYARDERPPYYYPPEKRFAVIIPAHNEGAHLPQTIRSLKSCLYPQELFSIFVIADNCTDDTSEVAVSCGANCLVREEVTLRGKNNALRWGLERIDFGKFDAVAIVDADTTVEPNFLEALNDYFCAGHRAVQVPYRIRGEENTPFGILQEVGNTAENLLFYGGRRKLGLSSFLRGNGMGFSRQLLKEFPFNERSVVEDLEYTARLLDSGERIEFAVETEVVAATPPDLGSSFSQRLRWASGSFGVYLKCIPKFFWKGIFQKRRDLLEASLGFLTLSRPLLVYLSLILISSALFLLPKGLALPVSVLNLLSVFLLIFYFLLAIPFEKQKKKALRSFLVAPFFGFYLGVVQLLALVGFNKGRWVRTARE
jgi:1,2-diacylglycerol 3-beta-glucosyltransferase